MAGPGRSLVKGRNSELSPHRYLPSLRRPFLSEADTKQYEVIIGTELAETKDDGSPPIYYSSVSPTNQQIRDEINDSTGKTTSYAG